MEKAFIVYNDEGNEIYSPRATPCITQNGEIYVFNSADDEAIRQDHVKPENVVFRNGSSLSDVMISGLFSNPFLFVEVEQDGMERDNDVRFKAISSDKSKTLFMIDLTFEEAVMLRDNFSFMINKVNKNEKKGLIEQFVVILHKLKGLLCLKKKSQK
jgi:hypothetical protein